MQRLPPKIDCLPQSYQVDTRNGPKTVTLTIKVPAGSSADSRSAQALIARAGQERSEISYKDALLALEEDNPSVLGLAAWPDGPFKHNLQAFVLAVQTAIPYDLQNLSVDVGNEAIQKALGASSVYVVEQKISGRTALTSDDLYLLACAFPDLDVPATAARQAYVRCAKGTANWAFVSAPAELREYAAERGWTPLKERSK